MNLSTSDLGDLNFTIKNEGEAVSYWSDDLPNVSVEVWAHEDGNRNMVEIDLTIGGVVGADYHRETHLVNIHDSIDHIHGIFAALLS
jgi:hypothetical protein